MFRLRQLVTFRYPGPIKVLTLGLVLSAILLPILGFVMWSTYESLAKMSEHSLNLQRGARTVAHRNELLTMHARLAAATGDPKWERQYRRIEPELDSALLRVAMLAREEYEKNYASQTKLAYTKLIEMESLGLALVRKGRQKETAEILFSEEYDRQKALYSQGVTKMIQAVETRIATETNSFRQRIRHTGFLMVTGLAILLAAWLGIAWIVRRYINLRRQSEEALAAEKETACGHVALHW